MTDNPFPQAPAAPQQPQFAPPAAPPVAPYGNAPAAPYAQPPMPPFGTPSPGAPYAAASVEESNKSFVVTWILALLLGGLGVDRFYLGKIGTGIAKLLTLGGWGIWTLVDLIITLVGAQRDKLGRPLAGYVQNKKIAWIVTASMMVLSIIGGVATGIAVATAGFAAVSSAVGSAQSDTEAPAEETDEPAAGAGDAASWAEDAYGSFEPVTQSGTGDSIVQLPAGATAGLVASTHDGGGGGYFAVTVLDDTNSPTGELLANTVGAYTGTGVYGFNALGQGTSLKIQADGNWTVTISPIATAPALAPAGTGDSVFLYDGSVAQLEASHAGEANFVIMEHTTDELHFGLIVNEIGAYSGTVPLSAGPSIIAVTADGSWTLVVK